MNLVEEIELPNGLVMQVWDASRSIAADTTKVELIITVPVTVAEDHFTSPEHFHKVTTVFGSEIAYQYKKERTFVISSNKEKVFNELLGDFRRYALPYLSKTSFPARFAISKLRDIIEHPYKYRHINRKMDS